MRSLLITFAIVVLTASAAFAEKEPVRCELCGMFWDKSTTRITAQHGGSSHSYESIGCLFQSVGSKADVASLKIIDYASAGGKSPKMIDGKSAHYLYGTSRLKGSMAPFTAAFSSKEAALKAQKDLGGEYVTFDGLWKKLDTKLKKKTAAKGKAACACGDPDCKGCAASAGGGCDCPSCAGKAGK